MEKEQENILMENTTVVFCDIVGFSRRDVDEQFQIISTLNKRVSQVLDKHLSYIGYNPNIIYLPTGDGMAVVFIAPSRFTEDLPFSLLDDLVEWVREEKVMEEEARKKGIRKEGVKLRIGVHHGAISLITVNRYPNVCGDTINACQRVMDAAHPNQMLISEKAFKKYFGEIIRGKYNYSPSPLTIIAKHNLELEVRILYGGRKDILTKEEPYPHDFIEGREERTRFLVKRIQKINKLSKRELKKIDIYEQAAFSTFWISPEALEVQDDKDMTPEYKVLLLEQQKTLNELVEKAGQFQMILNPESRPYSAKAMVGRYKALLDWMKAHKSHRNIDWVEDTSIGPNRLIINPKFCFEGYKHAPSAGYKSSLIFCEEAKLKETITPFDKVFKDSNEAQQDQRKQDVIDSFTRHMKKHQDIMKKRKKGDVQNKISQRKKR